MTTTTTLDMDAQGRVIEELAKIFAEIPDRLGVRTILLDAHVRLVSAVTGVPEGGVLDAAAQDHVNEKIVEVLREMATHVVEEFTRRTGHPFQWVDEPELEPEDGTLMSFALDKAGNVVLDNGPDVPGETSTATTPDALYEFAFDCVGGGPDVPVETAPVAVDAASPPTVHPASQHVHTSKP